MKMGLKNWRDGGAGQEVQTGRSRGEINESVKTEEQEQDLTKDKLGLELNILGRGHCACSSTAGA